VGGLIYEKDVFERLSLCITNFANPYTHNRQMTTEASALCVYVYTLNIYSVLAWANERCLSCVSWAMRRPVMPGWAENSTCAFFVY